MVTGGETVDYGSGGGVVDDVRAVIEVVQVVPTVKAPETKDMIQNQVLQETEEETR